MCNLTDLHNVQVISVNMLNTFISTIFLWLLYPTTIYIIWYLNLCWILYKVWLWIRGMILLQEYLYT